MRPESIQYLGVCFAEQDWDGDTRPDPASGLQRLETFYKGRGAQRHVYEVYQRLAQIYFDTTRYEEALIVMNKLLTRWPLRPENPEVLDRTVRALQRLRRFDQALQAQGRFASLFGPGTAWARRNVKRAAAAQALQRQHLVAAAAAHHGAARALRESGSTAAARPRYARAAQLYGALLGPLDRANRVDLELRHARAFCLFYAGELTLAAAAFAQVRDGGASRVMLEEAALMAIKAQEAQIDALVKAGRLTRPPLPEPPPAAATSPGPVPAAFARLQAALDAHVRLLPHSPRTPTLRYKAAEVPYRFSRFAEARPRLLQVYRKHCAHPIAVSAAQALLTSYRLTGPRAQVQTWIDRLRTGACGGRSGLAVHASEQAQRYHDGLKFKRALSLLRARRWSRAAGAFVDLAKTNPASELQVRALQNAGLCHEQLKQHASAAAIYAQIWQQHRASKAAPRALWRAALNRQRSHDFAGAIGAFTTLADQPPGTPHRLEALYNAGVLLAQDKQHGRAAAALLRYASSVSGATRADAREAAQAIYLAAIQLEQAKQPAAAARTLRRFVRRHGAQPGQGPRIVQAHAGLARLADARGDQARARRAHAAAVAAYARHKLSPATDGAAEAAAASAFWLAERELKRFLRLTIRGSVAAVGRQRRRMERQAAALKRRYEAVYAYKRARWTLAALFRQGVLLEHLARQVDAGFRNAPIPTAVRRLGPPRCSSTSIGCSRSWPARWTRWPMPPVGPTPSASSVRPR